MQRKMSAKVNRYISRKRRHRIWLKMVAVLACVVVFCTTYALILPAIALEGEKETYCGYEEHQHTDGCYEIGLICQTEEEEEGAGVPETDRYYAQESIGTEDELSEAAESGDGHTHTDDCYMTDKVLVCGQEEETGHSHDDGCFGTKVTCGMEESEGHSHTDDCYEMEEKLICEQEEGEEHSHSEACYEVVKTLICEQEESEGHVHSDDCYETVTICGKEEGEGHTHNEDCYETRSVLICDLEKQDETPESDEPGEKEIKEGTEEPEEGEYNASDETQEHVHTDDCYEEKLICGMEEHTHTLICYSNPDADAETAEVWEKTLPEELTGIWADDLAAVAKSQLGYEESTANYDVTEDEEIKGYTRYGDWYGDPYGDWNAMFAAFCLHYVGIPETAVPRTGDAQSWGEALQDADGKYGLSIEKEDYTPKTGDLALLDLDEDGKADRIGIVAEYKEAGLLTKEKVSIIEGDSNDRVESVTYETGDSSVMEYVSLPENTGEDIRFTKTYEEQGDYIVTVTYGAEAEIPEAAELRVSEYEKESDTYQARYAEAAEFYGWDEDKTDSIRLFHIGFFFEGEEIEPAAEVEVGITYINQTEGKEYQVTHFGQEGTETVPAETNYADGEQKTEFTLDRFSDIMLLAVGEDGFTVYTEDEVSAVEEYIIFLRTFSDTGSNAFSASSYTENAEKYTIKMEDENTGADKPVLKVDGTAYYLIPVSFWESVSGINYSFDKNTCPFVYSPDAYNSGANMTRASYVKVGEDWYLRVQDTGTYGDYTENGKEVQGVIPRNNIYYGGPADEASDYSGEWAIVRMTSDTEGAAMLAADNVEGNDNSARKAQNVTVTKENGVSFVSDAVTKWKFEKRPGGTYHISTIVDGETKYLYISETENGPVTLSNTPQEITLIENADSYPGKVYLCHKSTENAGGDPQAVGYDENSGFLSIGDTNDSRCWMTLCNATPIVNFHLVNINGEPLDGNADFTIQTESATRYVFAEERSSASIADNVVYIVPEISGYRYVGAKFKDNNNTYKVAYSVATKGYTDESGAFTDPRNTLRFYITEPTVAGQYYSRNMKQAEVTLYYAQEEKNTVNHAGTTINLFDYWVTTKDAEDSSNYDNIGAGINDGKGLKFKSGNGRDNAAGDANLWTGSANPCQGIVQNKLSEGYPILSGKKNLAGFINQSLDYLFDPGKENSYRESHTNVKNLLQIDQNGYYYYDCRENYAEFDETSNSFILYTEPVIKYGNDVMGQFFPFNPVIEAVGLTSTYDPVLNHYFGMTMSTHFIQQDGGKTKDNKDMIFEFSGDDDVWIFIDGALVADLGGIHDATHVTINFATGNISINEGAIETTIKNAFSNALEEGETLAESDWSGNTFADATTHTLDFFYLERGNNASNMMLKFNLVEIPVTSIFKVNQYGSPVAGAKFAVYAADETYNYLSAKGGSCITLPDGDEYQYNDNGDIVESNGTTLVSALYVGVTDSGGEMVFVNKERHDMPYSIAELEEKFGSHFILREIGVPDGYRLVNDEIKLSISQEADKVLLCHNTYDSGVWAAPTLQVTATDSIYLSKNHAAVEQEYYSEGGAKGTLFAVVFKRKENGELSADTSWSPVYGNNKQGYTVLDNAEEGLIKRAIEAAQAQAELGDRVVFYLSASGNMQAELKNLPGNIATYYYMLGSDDKNKSEYTVAYYWTEADSLSGATESNTWRVLANDASDHGDFTRVFGSTIQVPNMINRLFVQKMDDEGTLVNGAGFALYNVVEESKDATGGNKHGNTIYYVAEIENENENKNKDKVFLEEDADGDNQGKAWLRGGSAEKGGSYKVDSATGVITVEIDSIFYTITPVEISTTKYDAEENGTASFTKLAAGGYYYVREISAPEGYLLNPAQVMVRVTDDAVLANAGTANDGVVVARGPGYVASTLDQFASQGRIDNTLTWILTQMRISGESTSFDVTDKDTYYRKWKYIKNNYADDPTEVTEERSGAFASYLKYDTSAENTVFNYTINRDRTNPEPAELLTRRLYTDVGWSYLEIYQDYEYGKNEAGDAAYEKLVDENGDALEISNLFSCSVYIQVTDQRKGNLEISKVVVNPTAADDTTDTSTFTFTVNLKDASDKGLNGTYNYKVYEVTYNEDGTENRTPAESGRTLLTGAIQDGGQIVMSHNQLVVIEGLPGGTIYTITEEKNPAYSTTAKEKVLKTAADPSGIKSYDFGTEEKLAVEGKLYWHEENGVLDSVSKVAFTNTLRTTTIIAQKEWKGDEGSEIELTLYRVLGGGQPEVVGKRLKLSDSTIDQEPGDVANNSKATYRRNGWSVTWANLPSYVSVDGTMTECKWYVVEEAVENFLTSYSREATLTIDGTDTKAGEAVTGEDGVKRVTVVNTSAYLLPETGGSGTAMPRIIGMMLILTACLYGLYMKKTVWEGGAEKL